MKKTNYKDMNEDPRHTTDTDIITNSMARMIKNPVVDYEQDSVKSKVTLPDSKWNVITEDVFKNRISEIFNMVANALTNTLGPYGSTTIIEKYGEMYITKDGWQVLKSIHFNNNLDNNIIMMLVRIATQIVLKVGDGSTSSIVAADSILRHLKDPKNAALQKLRPKEFMDILDTCVKMISDFIYYHADKVNTDTFDEIYKLAYISTNGNSEIATMIQDIYKKTKNPSIDYVKAKDDVTRYDIVNGYKANITYLDSIFTNHDDNTCTVNAPYLLLFNYKIDTDKSLQIIGKAAEKAVQDHRRLIVVAPAYDKYLLEYIQKNVSIEFRASHTTTCVYTRVSLISNMTRQLYNDFAVMCGATTISESFLEDFDLETVNEYLGEVERITIGPKTTLIEGFIARNENMYEKIVEDATAKYKSMEADMKEKSIVDTKFNEMKQRVSKLRGSMGVIYVGGYSTMEKGANFDLVEDAVRACESAYTNGYNSGGSLIIPYAVDTILLENENEEWESDEIKMAMNVISEGFKDVFKRVLNNKYREGSVDNSHYNSIINECIGGEKLVCFDLDTEEYSDTIINSCVTDAEILKATVSIISLLISSNQYISIDNNTEN